MDASKTDRLKVFFERLRVAEPARNHDEALDLLATILNAVEDEMTSIAFSPTRWQTDGRMYPPQVDAVRDVPDFPNLKRYRSIGHNTFIADNGAIEIAVPPPTDGGTTVFSKCGSDGKHVQRR
jgi:hypothetical protein